MVRFGLLGIAALLATTAITQAQSPVERGKYLVETVMTCHNCHTPMGPNGPQFDKAFSGGLRFNEPPFDVTAPNITPDRATGIGAWSDADLKKALREGIKPRRRANGRSDADEPSTKSSRRAISTPLSPICVRSRRSATRCATRSTR